MDPDRARRPRGLDRGPPSIHVQSGVHHSSPVVMKRWYNGCPASATLAHRRTTLHYLTSAINLAWPSRRAAPPSRIIHGLDRFFANVEINCGIALISAVFDKLRPGWTLYIIPWVIEMTGARTFSGRGDISGCTFDGVKTLAAMAKSRSCPLEK